LRTYGTNAVRVIDFLKKIDLYEEHEKSNFSGDADDYLKSLFDAAFGLPAHLEKVCWFHLTRVPKEAKFCEGILPLHLVLDKIWSTIISIPKDPQIKRNLEKLRQEGVGDFQYALKTNDMLHSGPYAMLIRESAFHAKSIGNHDYLGSPEIIEDICNGYKSRFGKIIYDEITGALKKCIVKFESSKNIHDYLIASTLLYCWYKIRDEELDHLLAYGYNAEGETIPREAIRKIDFVEK
jgi:hypothetical protein